MLTCKVVSLDPMASLNVVASVSGDEENYVSCHSFFKFSANFPTLVAATCDSLLRVEVT